MDYEILVNKEHPIDKKYVDDVVKKSLVEIKFERDNDDIFEAYKIKDKKIYLEKETAKNWYELKNFLVKKGIQIDICMGFLSFEQQKNKYDEFLQRNGYELTEKRMALPGYSEHHTGLAIDCDFFKDGAWAGICNEKNEEVKFIHRVIYKFGFILRYPKNKQEITKMQYEPWHIRYVGKKIAKKLYEENLTLTEYYILKSKIPKN